MKKTLVTLLCVCCMVFLVSCSPQQRPDGITLSDVQDEVILSLEAALRDGALHSLSLWSDQYVFRDDAELFDAVWQAMRFSEWQPGTGTDREDILHLAFFLDHARSVAFALYNGNWAVYGETAYKTPEGVYDAVAGLIQHKLDGQVFDLATLAAIFDADDVTFSEGENTYYIAQEYLAAFPDVLALDGWVQDNILLQQAPDYSIRVSDGYSRKRRVGHAGVRVLSVCPAVSDYGRYRRRLPALHSLCAANPGVRPFPLTLMGLFFWKTMWYNGIR